VSIASTSVVLGAMDSSTSLIRAQGCPRVARW
jgi:hypothetical protein